jgi:hypothetical protein
MIKAIVNTPQGKVLVLGLSGENVTRLTAGEPIYLDLADLVPALGSAPVVICYGRTEESLLDDLRQHGLAPEGLPS